MGGLGRHVHHPKATIIEWFYRALIAGRGREKKKKERYKVFIYPRLHTIHRCCKARLNLPMMEYLDIKMEFHSSIFQPNCHIWGWGVGTPQADTLEGQGLSYGQRGLLPIHCYTRPSVHSISLSHIVPQVLQIPMTCVATMVAIDKVLSSNNMH